MPLRDVSAPEVARLATGIAELDRVLGGGLVPGSLVLLGGSPGIGKSTLTGMALGNLGAAGHRVLYVSGEESAAQVRLRAERLGDAALAVPALAETSLEAVLATLESERPDACVIDSVQTLHAEGMSGAPGSVGQVREAASAVMEVAKRLDCAVILVGHVTKEGRSRARGCSSTWSTACCSSRASASAASAPCGRSRTASARPARWACSKCARVA